MGKRELLLIVVFALVGILVYQLTAPPAAPGERSFSIRNLAENVRRAARGNRASAQTTTTTTYPLDPGIKELRFNLRIGAITITGENRTDIECELRVQSNGYDDAEATRLAKETVLKTNRAGSSFVAVVDFPVAGRQNATARLKVPASLAVRLEPNSGDLTIANVASVELVGARGDATIKGVRDRVTATHRGGDLTIEDTGSVKLNATGSSVRLDRIAREAALTTRAGEVKAARIAGPIEIESTNTELMLEKLEATAGALRITAVNGTIKLTGVRSEGRIDARNADVELAMDKAAAIAVFSDGSGDIEFTPPAGGYQLDAVTSDGDITLDEPGVHVTTREREHRAAGAVRGGGATITLRTTRGDITVRRREPAKSER